MDLSEIERELVAGGRAVFVRCAHLDGAVVCFVADGVPLELDACGRYKGCVVYRWSEVCFLTRSRATPEQLRQYHAGKLANLEA
jgi:hypothetical protein